MRMHSSLFIGDIMDIVYVANEKYAKYLGISMYSLLENNKSSTDINIHVFSTGICEESKKKLELIAKRFKRNIKLYDLENLKDRFSYAVDTTRFDISTMGRLFIGDVLGADIKRVIYLDCDTIIRKDISKLWYTELFDKAVGAVMEPTIYKRAKLNIGLEHDAPYYNAGVLLIDMEKWRAKNFTQIIIDYFESIKDKSLFNDQDAINGALKWQIMPISPIYNFFTNYKYRRYEDLIKIMPEYRYISKDEFICIKNDPAIIHFAGDERPWYRGNKNYYKKVYEKYRRKTVWKNESPEKGRELYMLLYHMLNIITEKFPKVRLYLSESFYEKMMDKKLGDK